jgi:hypothetical protein
VKSPLKSEAGQHAGHAAGNGTHDVQNGSATRFAFVPRRLEIEGRPELRNFSRNILFSSVGSRNGRACTGHSLYEPDLATFTDGREQRLLHRNKYGGDACVELTFRPSDACYSATPAAKR